MAIPGRIARPARCGLESAESARKDRIRHKYVASPLTLTGREGLRISRANCAPAYFPLTPIDLAEPVGRTGGCSSGGRSTEGPAGRCFGDQSRETDLPAEQIGAQTPAWLPDPHGDQGRSQSAGGPPRPRAQAAQRLKGAIPANGTLATADRLSRCGGRIEGIGRRVRGAGQAPRRGRPGARRLYGVAAGRQCRGAQPGAAAVARNGAVDGRPNGTPGLAGRSLARRPRLRGDRTARGARCGVRRHAAAVRRGTDADSRPRAGR